MSMIHKEICDAQFGDECTMMALQVLKDLKISVRKREKCHFVAFFCLWCAHKILGKVVPPEVVAERTHVSPGKMSKAIGVCCSKGYSLPQQGFSVRDFIRYYTPDPLPVVSIWTKIKSPSFENKPPQHVALALVNYHNRLRGQAKKISEKHLKKLEEVIALLDEV